MQRWAKALGQIGTIEMLDYPYMLAHRNRPDPLPQLIAAHRLALDQVRAKHQGRIVLIGKSMGSRIGCHVALEEKVHAIVCLGYPLCAAGARGKMRDQVLRELTTPILFVQGTRDRLCPLDILDTVRGRMQAVSKLEVVNDGDHSLAVTMRQLKASGETQDDVDRRLLSVIQAFVTDPGSSATSTLFASKTRNL